MISLFQKPIVIKVTLVWCYAVVALIAGFMVIETIAQIGG